MHETRQTYDTHDPQGMYDGTPRTGALGAGAGGHGEPAADGGAGSTADSAVDVHLLAERVYRLMLAEVRLERARELLRQTNMPILDIAVATGFTSHSYFAQSYRLQFGRPPSEERRTTY